jgi:sugar phosphate isomerase/epimerase
MPPAERFGFNSPAVQPIEQTLRWAAEHGFHHVDFNADRAPNRDFDAGRVSAVRELCERHIIGLAIHTSSAVNNAEIAPYVSEAVDEYLRDNLRLARRLGGEGVIVHGGFHFTDVDRRRAAAVARLQRLVEFAATERVPLWLENHNTEPEHAEMNYIPDNVDELRWFLEAPGLSASTGADNPWFRWSFNAGHANLVADKIPGFLDTFGVARIAQVRIADNYGRYEIHLVPGQGTIDFPDLFRRLDSLAYTGPFSLDFGTLDDKLRIRDQWLNL